MTDPMPQPLPQELHDLLDGRLDAEAADAVRARIASDPVWAEAWDELQRIQGWVRTHGAEHEPPAALKDSIRARIAALDAPAEGDGPAEADAEARAPTEAHAASDDGASGDDRVATPPRRGRMLRMLTLSYATAALLVVGFTVSYVALMEEPAAVERLEEAPVDLADGVTPPKPEAAGGLKVNGLDASEPAGSVLDGTGAKPRAPADARSGERAFLEDKALDDRAGAPSAGEQDRRGRPAPRQPGGAVQPGIRKPTDQVGPAKKLDPAEKKARGTAGAPPPPARAPSTPRARGSSRQGPPEGKLRDRENGDAADRGDAGAGFGSTWGSRDVLARAQLRMAEGDVVYVIETDDPVATRAAVVALLKESRTTTAARRSAAQAGRAPQPGSMGIGGGSGGRPAPSAPKPVASPPVPSTPGPPAAPANEPVSDAPAAAAPAAVKSAPRAETLYRLAEGKVVDGLRAKLAEAPTPALAMFAEINRPLTTEAVARLEARRLAEEAQRLVRLKKAAKQGTPTPRSKAASEDDDGSPEAAPTPLETGTEEKADPQRADEKKASEEEERKAATGDDRPRAESEELASGSDTAKSERRKASDGQPDTGGTKAPPRPKRLRIIILERK